jgi:hypothetical protein
MWQSKPETVSDRENIIISRSQSYGHMEGTVYVVCLPGHLPNSGEPVPLFRHLVVLHERTASDMVEAEEPMAGIHHDSSDRILEQFVVE